MSFGNLVLCFLAFFILVSLIQGDDDRGQSWGSLEGRVTFAGDIPPTKSLEDRVRSHRDAGLILKAPRAFLTDPVWRIDPSSRGVSNVVVFLKRPANMKLPIHPDDKTRKETIAIDCPFAVFVPHVIASYPSWFDGDSRGTTGQSLVVKNSSELDQLISIVGKQTRSGVTLPKGNKLGKEVLLQAQELPITIQSDVYPWMNAYIWVFDHPYIALTKEDGKFKIPRIPTGIKIQIMAWHESKGWLFGKEGRALERDGKRVFEFELTAGKAKEP